MGHSAPLRKKEWSESSVRSLKDLHKPVLCLDGSPACELSALLFSLQSVVTLLQNSAPGTLDRWHQHSYPVPKRGDTYTGSLSNMGCAESRTSSSTVSVASSRLQLWKYKEHMRAPGHSVEAELFQSINTGTGVTLVTAQMHIHTTDLNGRGCLKKLPRTHPLRTCQTKPQRFPQRLTIKQARSSTDTKQMCLNQTSTPHAECWKVPPVSVLASWLEFKSFKTVSKCLSVLCTLIHTHICLVHCCYSTKVATVGSCTNP